MGGGSWSDDAYRHIKTSYTSKSRDDIFTSTKTSDDMSPKGITFRESRDSDEHPLSLAINIFLDVTGSMGTIPEYLIREKLGALMNTIIKHGVDHPQVLFGAIGDHISDRSSLQIGQFESDTELLNKWLAKIYIEGNGGGQNMESYHLAWLFAGRHTSIDCFEKRNQKGFLFTIGDEWVHPDISADHLREIMGYSGAESVTKEQILREAQRMYNVFHIHVNHGSYSNDTSILRNWKDLLGERLIILDDHDMVAEVIASTIAVIHGADIKAVTSGFDNKTALVVSKAVGGLTPGKTSGSGIVTL